MSTEKIKLKKLGPGQYQTLDGRYNVEHQDGETECDHPLCYTLHRKYHTTTGAHGGYGWYHSITYVSWHVWDNKHDDYAGGRGPNEYDTKKEAVEALIEYIKDDKKREQANES